MDPTVPTHPGQQRRGATTEQGQFVRKGSQIVLVSDTGGTWGLEMVSFLRGAWGGGEEGVEKFPRPTVYDAAGNVVVQGDRVLIDFIGGSWRRPVILGAAYTVQHADFFRYLPSETPENDTDRLRARFLARGTGPTVQGRVDIRVCDDGAGTASLRATDGIDLGVAADPDSPARLRVQMDRLTVEITAGGTTQKMVLGDAFMADLAGAFDALATFFGTTAGATTAPQIAAAAVVLLTPGTAFPTFLLGLAASLAAGAPYLSNRAKTE